MTSSKRRTGIFRELKLWAQERSRHTKRRNDQSVLGLNSSDFERLLNVARLVNRSRTRGCHGSTFASLAGIANKRPGIVSFTRQVGSRASGGTCAPTGAGLCD